MRFQDQVAVVTGGARGIGRAVALAFIREGARVVLVDIDKAGLAALREEIERGGGQALAAPCDISGSAEVKEMVNLVERTFGRIDILVNSVGIIRRGPIETVSEEDWDAMMEVNLRGAFLCCQIVGREMIARAQGKIVNISSNVSQVLQPHRGAYAVTKAGLSHLTRVLALEWAPHHINVNAIAPAPTITDLNRKFFEDHPEDFKARTQSIPLGRLGIPQDYVGAAVFLASRASDFVTGQTYFVDGGSNLI